jgi:hypothetical protein
MVQGSQPFQFQHSSNISWLKTTNIFSVFLPSVMDCDG